MVYFRVMNGILQQLIAFCLVAVSAGGLLAQSVQPVRFSSMPAEIEPLKLLIPILRDAHEVPRKPVALTRYRFTDSHDTWFEDHASGLEFWAESQFATGWVDPSGNVMTLALMTKRLPSALVDRHLTREAFNEVMDDTYLTLDRDSKIEELAVWMSHFSQLPVQGEPRVLRMNTSRLAKLVEFSFADTRIRSYAFRLNPLYPGQAQAPHGWFALVINFAHLLDGDADRTIGRALLSNLKTTSAFEGTRARFAKKNRSSSVDPDVQESLARDLARRSIHYMSTWWYMESKNAIMLSDHRTAERFAPQLLADLESARLYFEQAIPPFATATDMVGVVRLFENADDYVSYVGDTVSGLDVTMTGGIFDGRRRELVIRPARNLTAQSEGSLKSIIKHEGFHQYVFSAMGGITPSAWLNEGVAVFFENCEIDRNGKIQVNESKRHSAVLENLIKNPANDWELQLPAHLYLDYPAFYADPDVNYALAYGLIYYLVRGAPFERNQPYANFLPTYLAELERTADPQQATQAALDQVDARKLTRSFVTFWKTVKLRQDAKRTPGLRP